MPNPHFDVKVISRSAGSSAVASASYRSASALHDDRLGKDFDYTRKEHVVHSEILAPDSAPDWVQDREQLWNRVEAGEKRKDAQLARDTIAALPRELTLDQNKELLRDFVRENFTSKGMVADVSIHEERASDGKPDPHAHIMLTMREIDGQGFGKKNRDWNRHELVPEWRTSWETLTNAHLEAAGRSERVSLQSYAERGIVHEPEHHLGYGAQALEEQGIETRVGNHNRQAHHSNELVGSLYQPPESDEIELSWAERIPGGLDLDDLGHEFELKEYVTAGYQGVSTAAAQLWMRLEDFFDRAGESARNAFDRLVPSVREQEEPQVSGNDQQYGRGREARSRADERLSPPGAGAEPRQWERPSGRFAP